MMLFNVSRVIFILSGIKKIAYESIKPLQYKAQIEVCRGQTEMALLAERLQVRQQNACLKF